MGLHARVFKVSSFAGFVGYGMYASGDSAEFADVDTDSGRDSAQDVGHDFGNT